jgi:ubiquinone biosynthesis protein UbiJ
LLFQGNDQALMALHKVIENFEFDWEGLLADHIGDLSAAALVLNGLEAKNSTTSSMKWNASTP